MSQNKTKIIMALSSLTLLAGMAGCSRQEADSQAPIDSGKTQLYVKYYNGGLRREWLDKICENFEKDYENYSFEEGKKGIQIVKDFEKTHVLADAITTSDYNVFIMESVDYFSCISKNAMLDITDVVQGYAPIDSATNETKAIESKMYDDSRSFYNVGTESSPRYYGLPFYESSCALNYNVDLFDEKGFYFAESKTAEGWSDADLNSYAKVSELFVASSTDKKSKGPDGKTGTVDGVDYSWDDGLPATYDDFHALLTYMSSEGVTPMVWNGYEKGYLTSLALSAWANSSGYDQMKNILSFSGTSTKILDVDDDYHPKTDDNGNYVYTDDISVSASTVASTHQQKGCLDACDFVSTIMSNKAYYLEQGFKPSFMHTTAQNYFINGTDDQELVSQPIGMLVDGSWWNSEATSSYKGDSKKTKKFGVMPMPKPTAAQIGEGNVALSDRDSSIFVNASTPTSKVKAAKTFVAYLNSDRSMNTFSQYTDMMRLMNYDLTDETLGNMTYYGKASYKYFHAPTTKHLDWRPMNETAASKTTALGYRKWGFSIDASNDNPFQIFYDGKATSAEDLFAQINSYYKVSWKA